MIIKSYHRNFSIENLLGFASFLTLPKNYQTLFQCSFDVDALTITVPDLDKLKVEFKSLTGFSLHAYESKSKDLSSKHLPVKAYKELIDKKMIPFDASFAHDGCMHVIPALNLSKDIWASINEIHRSLENTLPVSLAFEYGSVLGVPNDALRVIETLDPKAYLNAKKVVKFYPRCEKYLKTNKPGDNFKAFMTENKLHGSKLAPLQQLKEVFG